LSTATSGIVAGFQMRGEGTLGDAIRPAGPALPPNPFWCRRRRPAVFGVCDL